MRLALILSISLFAMAIAGCDSKAIDGVDNPTMADLNPPENPELCAPACQVLTGTCDANDADDGDDVEILRGCIGDCLKGAFSDEELECLVAADCTTIDDCLD